MPRNRNISFLITCTAFILTFTAVKQCQGATVLDYDSFHEIWEDSETKCKPTSFGYSLEEAELKFPPYPYPKCSERPHFQSVASELSTSFSMNCTQGHYLAGPKDKHLFAATYDNSDLYTHTGPYTAPVNLPPDTEFVFANCNSSDYEVAHYRAVYDAQLHDSLRRKQQYEGKPRQVLVLTLDSFSRRHFYSKLPKTVQYLRDLEDYHVTDFRLHNVAGDNSVDNILPLFTAGIDKASIKSRGVSSSLNGRGLWSMFRRAGYLTLLGFEDCDDDEVKYLGRNQDVHILIRQFFCAASKYTTYSDATLNLKQRCIGAQQSHVYALDYLLQVTEMYWDVNQWMYLHINTAHEASGRHAQTLDQDLVVFLEKLLSKRTHEVALLLMGDHGMRYGDWRFTLDAILEHRLPALFTVLSDGLVNATISSNLAENSLRLVTKQDLRKTLLELGEIGEMDKNAVGYDLLGTVIPKSRSCDEADIDFRFCSCYPIAEYRDEALEDGSEIAKLGRYLMAEAVEFVHMHTYARTDMSKGRVCKSLLPTSLEAVYRISMQDGDSIRVDFASGSAVFSGMFSVSADVEGCRPVYYMLNKLCVSVRDMQVLQVTRLTPYKGPCEEISKRFGFLKGLCLCQIDN